MQTDVVILRLDTYNYQIDAVCLNFSVTIIMNTLLLSESNEKLTGMSQFFIKLQGSYSLLKCF